MKQGERTIEFCSGGGCCPVLVVLEDGRRMVCDEGREVLSPQQVEDLFVLLKRMEAAQQG